MNRRAAIASAIDVVLVIAFAVIGRRNHHESGSAVAGALKVAAPFLIGLAAGWLAARLWRAPMSVRSGVVAWLSAVVVGLALRRLAFDRGIALGFIIVATITLGVFLVGWRAVSSAVARRRPAPRQP